MNPSLTISVMTYNRSEYLRIILDSICLQTNKNFIVKIYDNGSTDNTHEIVQPYLQDKRFSYIQNESNIGSGNNFNKAITDCDTEFLLLAHDDDVMLPDFINAELQVITDNSSINLVCTDNNYIDDNGKLIQRDVYNNSIVHTGQDVIIGKNEFIDYYISGKNLISCPTVMLRTSILKKYNILYRLNIGKSADTFFWFELNMLDGNFYFLNKSLFNYRLHEGQDSKNTIYMIPVLKRAVHYLLKQNNYPLKKILKWDKFINKNIKDEFKRTKYNKIILKNIRKDILLYTLSDFSFFIFFHFYYYFPFLFSIYKKTSKSLFRYYRFIRRHI